MSQLDTTLSHTFIPNLEYTLILTDVNVKDDAELTVEQCKSLSEA
jgi:hypothetical protein